MKINEINIDSFWQAVQNEKIPGTKTLLFTKKICSDINRYRFLILNPFSYYDLNCHQFQSKLTASIQMMKDIQKRLKEKVGITQGNLTRGPTQNPNAFGFSPYLKPGKGNAIPGLSSLCLAPVNRHPL